MSYILMAALLGLIPGFIANGKGRSFFGWWVYGTLLFIIAIIHVLIIPSIVEEEISSGELRECPFCAEFIKSKATKCKHCGSSVEPINNHPGPKNAEESKTEWKLIICFVFAFLALFIVYMELGVGA